MCKIDMAIAITGIVMLCAAFQFHSAGAAVFALCSFVLVAVSKPSYHQVEKPLLGHDMDRQKW